VQKAQITTKSDTFCITICVIFCATIWLWKNFKLFHAKEKAWLKA